MNDTDYKTALVTGASSGIGYATVKKLTAKGIKVYATARRINKLKQLKLETGCEIIPLDILDQKQIYKSFENLDLDILVNNAGIGKAFSSINQVNPADINITTETNITSFLHLLRALVPNMVKKKKGHLINIGSIGGLYPMAPSVYPGTKGAVHMINQNLRLELAGTGIRVTEICPGRVKTEFFDTAFADNPKKKKEIMSGYNMLTQDDIADAILYAILAPWRVNISLIEITPTEQAPGGSVIKKVKVN